MRGYSRFRVLLLGVLLTVASVSSAQTTAPAAGTSSNQGQGLLHLILAHPDAVFFTIVLLSITGFALIIQGFIKTQEKVFMPESSTAAIKDLIAERRFKELIDFTETDPSFVSKVLHPALKRAPSFSAMKESMETAIGEQTAEQFRRIEYLNIIGNLGPLLGLLGTVLGMIYAFQEVSSSEGRADVSKLSYGISTALCHTFLGLFLAVPCLGAFGWLRTRVDRLTIRGALVAEEILLMIKPAEARPVAAPAHPAHAAPAPGTIPPPPPRPAPAVARP
jgi:biopolymer transport protein ExbB